MIEEQIEQRAEEYSEAFMAKGVAKASFIKGAKFGYNKAAEDFAKENKQDKQLTEAKEIIKIGLEGIKREFIVAGNTRPFAKEALELCNEYCEKAEAFLKE